MPTYTNGAFVFYRTTATCQPLTPAEIERLVVRAGLSTTLVPAYAGDRQQVSRALAQVAGKVARNGWELTSIKTARHEVVYGISAMERDQARERVDFTFADRLRWSDDGGNGQHIAGTHPVAQAVDTAYQGVRGRICPGDWSASLTQYLLEECQAVAFREDGRVYWVPPSALEKLPPLTALLAQVGIALVVCEVQAETRTVVQDAARESLADQLDALQASIAAFDGTQKPSNYRKRMAELETLRRKAQVYHDTLAIGVEQAQGMLETLVSHVQALLEVRETITVHRATPPEQAEHATPVAAGAPW